jgi:hypothetical protein
MSEQSKKSCRPTNPEIPGADPADVERLQSDLLACLQKSGQDPISYAGLAYCSPQGCGRVGCSEACAYGHARRRQLATPRIANLLTQQPEPLYEVRVYRPFWVHDLGGLVGCNDIQSAKNLVRRALDNLYDNTLIAVGTYKLKFIPFVRWLGLIDLIVAAHDQEALAKAFGASKHPDFRIAAVRDLKTKIAEVFNCGLAYSKPEDMEDIPPDQRAEFYSWLLTLGVDARIVRYGCDHNFGLKERKPRTIKPKKRRRHSYPAVFEHYWFGSGEAWNSRPDPNQVGFEPKNPSRAVPFRPTAAELKAWYDDDDDDEKK